jgi:hypothetical protein
VSGVPRGGHMVRGGQRCQDGDEKEP